MSLSEGFTFHPMVKHQFPGYEKSSTQEYLMKWALKGGMKLQAFAFDRPYKTYLYQEFVKDFLATPAVTSTLECQSREHQFAPIGLPAETVELSTVKCSLTSMSIFDRLSDEDSVVRKSGAIKKCMEEYCSPTFDTNCEYGAGIGDQIEVSDELRKMLLSTESEYADLYTENEKEEFLFRIFKHLVIGGSLCQYEDQLSPYLEISKILYKDLVGVNQEEGGELTVTSSVIRILGAKCDSCDPSRDLLFYRPHLNNFFYLIVDPFKRVVLTLYHQT